MVEIILKIVSFFWLSGPVLLLGLLFIYLIKLICETTDELKKILDIELNILKQIEEKTKEGS